MIHRASNLADVTTIAGSVGLGSFWVYVGLFREIASIGIAALGFATAVLGAYYGFLRVKQIRLEMRNTPNQGNEE